MIVLDCEQYSDEWWDARLGIPTASMMSSIVTSEGKKSSSWKTALNKLAAEKLRGKPDETFQSDWMKRGHELEDEAAGYYSFLTGRDLQKVGICFRDQKDAGFSPDALASDRGLEIKCVSPGVHVGYLREDKVPTTYKPQVYSSLYLSDFELWDFMSYHPDMKPLIVSTTKADDQYLKYAAALDKYLPLFVRELNGVVNELTKYMEAA